MNGLKAKKDIIKKSQNFDNLDLNPKKSENKKPAYAHSPIILNAYRLKPT